MFLIYDTFKSHVNSTERFNVFTWGGEAILLIRRLGQVLSTNNMISYRKMSTIMRQLRSWIWNGGIYMDGLTSVRSS